MWEEGKEVEQKGRRKRRRKNKVRRGNCMVNKVEEGKYE